TNCQSLNSSHRIFSKVPVGRKSSKAAKPLFRADYDRHQTKVHKVCHKECWKHRVSSPCLECANLLALWYVPKRSQGTALQRDARSSVSCSTRFACSRLC